MTAFLIILAAMAVAWLLARAGLRWLNSAEDAEEQELKASLE